jgi:TRAP-type C4-dicarboxylate transport system permease small subunit
MQERYVLPFRFVLLFMNSPKKCRRLQTLGGQIAAFTGAMLLVAAILIAAIWHWRGSETAAVTAILAGICYAASVFGFIAESVFGHQSPLVGVLMSMAFRTGFPLAAIVALRFLGGRFAQPETIIYLLILYFGALLAHVAISYGSLKDSCSAELGDCSAK